MIRQELIRHEDNLYIVEAKYPNDKVRVDKTQDLKEALGCDIVLKSNGWLFYCKRIEEAEIVE
jgi:hypothetical protein